MSRLAFVFRTDVHVADKNPASWKGDYSSEIFSNLTQIGILAEQYNATAVLDGGDFFHVKTSVWNSHALVIKVLKLHEDYPCPVYCIEGNHDITGNNLSTIQHQPLGVLYASKSFRHLRDETFEVSDLRVRVVGFPYSPSRSLQEIQEIRKRPGEDYLIAVVHALAADNPPSHVEEFFGEPVFRYQDLIFEDGPDIFCFGHWHKDQGVTKIEGRYFVNQGAVSRGALIKENLERNPNVSLIELTKTEAKITVIPLKVAPASEVFDLDRKERQDQEASIISQYVDQLEEDLKVDSEQDVESRIKSLTFAPEVRNLALSYLEKARYLEKTRGT